MNKKPKIGDRPECKKCGDQYSEYFIKNSDGIFCETCYFKRTPLNVWKYFISKEYRSDVKKNKE